MAAAIVKVYTENFNVPTGFYQYDLIFSLDFTGTLNGVAYAGATDFYQSFDGNGSPISNQLAVVVTAGSVRLAGTLQ